MESARPKPSLRERNKIRLRAELLDTVLDLFLNDDPNALNIEAVARNAGCSKATVYVYFPGGLNDMLCAIYIEIADEIRRAADRLRDPDAPVADQVIALARALFDMSARPRRGRFFALLNPAITPALQPVLGRSSGWFETTLTTLLTGRVAGDAGALATLLVGALREANVKIAKDPIRKEVLMAGFATLVRGVLVAAPTPPSEVSQ